MRLFSWGEKPKTKASPEVARQQIKPFAERTNQEKVVGLTKLIESLRNRRTAIVERIGTENPNDPSARAELTAIEESIMWKELSLEEFQNYASEESAFAEHAETVRTKIIKALNVIGDLEYEDYHLENTAPTDPRRDQIRHQVEELYKKVKDLKEENPLAHP